MSKSAIKIAHLIYKQLGETSTVEEQTELDKWKNRSAGNRQLAEELANPKIVSEKLKYYYEIGTSANTNVLNEIMDHMPNVKKMKAIRMPSFVLKYAVASVFFILLMDFFPGGGVLNHKSSFTEAEQIELLDSTFGGNNALLTLADGRTIVLDNAANGRITKQGGILSTPKGVQYQLNLPDGSKVWLNAASSISYPAAFTGQERKVTIKGEAYFEIAKDAKSPFRVHFLLPGGDQRGIVEVFGTKFNVKAYKDETSETTLIEGKVSVALGGTNLKEVLTPGKQACLYKSNSGKQQMTVSYNNNLGQVLAWKNGVFCFNKTPMREVMRQISRWYDVDVEFTGKLSELVTGEIRRNESLAGVLYVIEQTGIVKFKIEGRKVIVTSQDH